MLISYGGVKTAQGIDCCNLCHKWGRGEWAVLETTKLKRGLFLFMSGSNERLSQAPKGTILFSWDMKWAKCTLRLYYQQAFKLKGCIGSVSPSAYFPSSQRRQQHNIKRKRCSPNTSLQFSSLNNTLPECIRRSAGALWGRRAARWRWWGSWCWRPRPTRGKGHPPTTPRIQRTCKMEDENTLWVTIKLADWRAKLGGGHFLLYVALLTRLSAFGGATQVTQHRQEVTPAPTQFSRSACKLDDNLYNQIVTFG